MVINRKEKPMGSYPFGLFLVSSDPTYEQNISPKALNHFERFPRKSLRFLLVKGEMDEEFLLEKWMDITAAIVLIKHFCLTFWGWSISAVNGKISRFFGDIVQPSHFQRRQISSMKILCRWSVYILINRLQSVQCYNKIYWNGLI